MAAPVEQSPERRNDLWHATKHFDYGPEGNLKLWTEAAAFLEQLVEAVAVIANDAAVVAVIDARERAEEEARRAKAEVDMRREWAAGQPKEADIP